MSTVLAAGLDRPRHPADRRDLVAIAVIVLLITRFKLHAFLALTIGSLALGAFAGTPLDKVIDQLQRGLGSTVAGVGVLIALGAILGKLLADSGGADQIVDTILGQGPRRAPCPGRWCSSPRSSGCRCSSRSASCC